MIKVYSKALDKHIEVDRIIGEISGEESGPCLIFIGGIHGNEPSGVFALRQVIDELKENKTPIKGSIIALAGNLWALEKSERFEKQDLNRLWIDEKVEALENGSYQAKNEDEKQQEELFSIIQNLLSTKKGPFYFFDLHTTSSQTPPFLTVNDSLLNRKFTQQYPVPMILGIEEYLDGPILSYINELGYVSFGFESGQHDDLSSINNHIAFTYLSLVFSGAVDKNDINYQNSFQALNQGSANIFEIYHRHEIAKDEKFTMEPGFVNFQRIQIGQHLAMSNGQKLLATENANIFMPLYQSKGDDGFFVIRRIPLIFLQLSSVLRRWRFDRILPLLPGIRRSDERKDTLIVDLRIARLLAKQFLHVLGYRSKKIDQNHLVIKNRESNSRNGDYEKEVWYN